MLVMLTRILVLNLGLEYEAEVLDLVLGLATEGQVLGLGVMGLAEYLVLKFQGQLAKKKHKTAKHIFL